MQDRTIPSVSVVMPAYNAEKYLREAIDSILSQTFTDFEFIIINDGSNDSTKDIILSYDDPRIVYLENKQNSGICVTLNKGLDAARGRYIARMDSDDIMMPRRLAIQVEYMDSHPEIGVAGSDIIVFGDGIGEYTFNQIHSSDDCSAGLIFNPCFAHPSVIIRKSILDKYNIAYDDRFRGLEDFRMWWEIAKNAKLNNIPEPLIKYRHHPGQETRNVKPSVITVSNYFRALRYRAFDISLSEKECEIVNDYSYGNYENFGLTEFGIFVAILSQICKAKERPIITSHKALQKVCGKAVAYTISQSSKLRPHKRALLSNALLKGVMSPMWYFKYLKSTFVS